MMKKIALALLLVSLALASERVVFYGGDASAKSLFDEWGVLAALLLAAGIFLTALVYMLGNFLMNEKIKDWAKTEAVELFYSGVLLAMIVSVYVGGNEAADALTRQFDQYSAGLVCAKDTVFTTFTYESGGESVSVDSVPYKYLPACHLKIAKNFMASLFYEVAGFVKAVGITHSWYTYWSSLGVDFGPVGSIAYFAGGSLSIAPFGYLSAKNNALAFLFENGVKVLMLVRFQEILINFVGSALFPVLLMSGLILRSFMVTRKLGGLLMALALSLYFIFPLFYVLGDMAYTSVIIAQHYDENLPQQNKTALAQIFVDLDSLPKKINGTYQENSSLNTDGSNASREFLKQLGLLTATEACNKTLQDVESEQSEWGSIAKYANLTKIWEKFSGGNTLLGTWLSGLYGKGGWSDSFPGISSPIATAMNTASFDSVLDGIDVLAKAMFFSMFFSFLSIFATIAAVKSLSPMLGGDVEIAGLTHLI